MNKVAKSFFYSTLNLMSKKPDYHIELMNYIEKHNYKPQRDKPITLDNGIVIENVGRTSDYYRKKYPDYKEFFENTVVQL